jgi:hypothetical protein
VAPEMPKNKVGQDGILRADWQSALVLAGCRFLPPEAFPLGIDSLTSQSLTIDHRNSLREYGKTVNYEAAVNEDL